MPILEAHWDGPYYYGPWGMRTDGKIEYNNNDGVSGSIQTTTSTAPVTTVPLPAPAGGVDKGNQQKKQEQKSEIPGDQARIDLRRHREDDDSDGPPHRRQRRAQSTTRPTVTTTSTQQQRSTPVPDTDGHRDNHNAATEDRADNGDAWENYKHSDFMMNAHAYMSERKLKIYLDRVGADLEDENAKTRISSPPDDSREDN